MKLNWQEMDSRQRDALIAEKVMGWKKVEVPRDIEAGTFYTDGPGSTLTRDGDYSIVSFSPSTDISAAFQVVEKMRSPEFGFEMIMLTAINGGWFLTFIHCKRDQAFQSSGKSLPEAICLAALKALGVEV